MFLRSDDGEIRTALDEGRSSASRALHRRAEHLASADKPRYARDLRRQGWSYRHIADVLKEPYRRIAQWLSGDADEARPPPRSAPAATTARAPPPASVAETLTALAAPPLARAPARPAAAAERDLQAVTRTLETLSGRLDDLVAAIAADRESQRKERADRRARDAKLLALVEQLAAKMDGKMDDKIGGKGGV